MAVSVAVMVMVPVFPVTSEVARPKVPRALPMVTDAPSDELQTAAVVQSIAVPFEKTATASNCRLVPVAMVGSAGVTFIAVSFPPFAQLMKPIVAAKSATAAMLPYFKIFIILFSLVYLIISPPSFSETCRIIDGRMHNIRNGFYFQWQSKRPQAFALG